MTSTILKYHTVSRDRLVEFTKRDLESCGIPARALGRVSPSFRVTLVGAAASPSEQQHLAASLLSVGLASPSEHQHLAASLLSEGLRADVIAGLLGHRKKFPLIMAAMLRRGGGADVRPAQLDDLPLLALLTAWEAAQLQEHGLKMLAVSATRAATTPGLGYAGVRAREAFAEFTFDLFASEAIDECAVDIEVAPLDLCTGVLPIAQLALHLWLKHHHHVDVDTKELEKLPRAVNFVKDQAHNEGYVFDHLPDARGGTAESLVASASSWDYLFDPPGSDSESDGDDDVDYMWSDSGSGPRFDLRGVQPATFQPAPALCLHTIVLPGSPNLLAATPLLAAGWTINLFEGAHGPSITVPGVSRAFPLHRDRGGSVIVTFVASPRGLLLRNDSLAHRCMVAHEFILDTAAEVCLVGAESLDLLCELFSLGPQAFSGVGGPRTQTLDAGLLIIQPAKGAVLLPPAGTAEPAATIEPAENVESAEWKAGPAGGSAAPVAMGWTNTPTLSPPSVGSAGFDGPLREAHAAPVALGWTVTPSVGSAGFDGPLREAHAIGLCTRG